MRRRKLWLGLWVVVGVLVLAGAWAGWTAYQVNHDLNEAVDDAQDLRGAVESGDDAAMQRALGSLKEHSEAAADRTDGVTWSTLRHLPVFGDDARGVAVASDVAADLSKRGAEPLVRVSSSLSSVVPKGGRVNVDALAELRGAVATGNEAFADADRRLGDEDSSGYVERLRMKYRELAREVRDASQTLGSAHTALEVLPAMLGQDGPRNYLLVFQNNAEIRATGGLPGAVSLVRANNGKVELTRQVAANSFGYTDKPVLPLTKAERQIYDPLVGTFFLNANFQPDFSRASDLWRARWEQVYPEKLDGVLSLDPVAISYVLGATGPITVDGIQLNQENAVDQLLHQVYLDRPKPADQDAFFRQVAQSFFDRVSKGVESPQSLVRALTKGVRERRIYVHAFEDQLQKKISGKAIAGDLVTDPGAAPQVGVYLNDATGAKMSYYLRYKVDVDSTYCAKGIQGLNGHMVLMSEAPRDAAKSLPDYITGGGAFEVAPGTQIVMVNIYGPVEGAISAISLNGKPIEGFPAVADRGRKVATTYVELAPQSKVDLTWRMRTGPRQSGPVDVDVTPSLGSSRNSMTVGSSC